MRRRHLIRDAVIAFAIMVSIFVGVVALLLVLHRSTAWL